MRIRVLGSSSGWPMPRLGCRCPQCTSSDPRDRRLRPALLLERTVLVDAGPDLYQQLRLADALPDAILLTHSHLDHVLGLYELAKIGRVPLYCSPETERRLREILTRMDLRAVRIAPGERIELPAGLTAQAFDVDHGSERTFGYRFTGGSGETMVYMPDVGSPPTSKLARRADLLVIDGSSRDRTTRGHLSIAAAVPVARTLGARHTLFTHIGHHSGLHVDLDEWLPEGFGVAWDGLEINLRARAQAGAGSGA